MTDICYRLRFLRHLSVCFNSITQKAKEPFWSSLANGQNMQQRLDV